jgi:hypothetical protein
MAHQPQPVICQVRNKITGNSDLSDQEPVHIGSHVLDISRSNKLKKLLFEIIGFRKIVLPYRFTLISCEILYEAQQLVSIRVAGFYLSGITIPSGQPQISEWKSIIPPETRLSSEGYLYNQHKLGRTYFVAHRYDNELYIFWNLGDNYNLLTNQKGKILGDKKPITIEIP